MNPKTQTASLSETLLPEFDQEMKLTRTSLERVPDDKFDWKPHPKSPTLGWLAGFMAILPTWVNGTIDRDSIDLGPGKSNLAPPVPPRTREQVLALFDQNVAAARRALEGATDETLQAPWTLLMNDKPIQKQPRSAIYRSMFLSHMVHHRAQLGVYYRLLDLPVPAIYGPTADENPWAKA